MIDTFAITVRMMWIDDVIDLEGRINRADIMRGFGISAQQASVDIKRYMAINPRRIAYDCSQKCYIQIEGSRPCFENDARNAATEIVRVMCGQKETT